MSQTLVKAAPVQLAVTGQTAWLPFALVLTSVAVLYVPTVLDLYHQLWVYDNNSQQPIVLAMLAWLLFHQGRTAFRDERVRIQPAVERGAAMLGVGLLVYILGRSQSLLSVEVLSLMPVLLGIAWMFWGTAFTKRIWFAFFFVLFAIPLPPSFVDVLTQPMKVAVSWAAENLLRALDYPIARSGVVLYVGQFQLLVADACAGLNSLFTLEALGLLYLNVVRHESVFRNVLLAALIVPISFTANTIRVVVLALITYHWGDEAGQGFLHGFSGMLLFLSALFFIIMLDGMLRQASTFFRRSQAA